MRAIASCRESGKRVDGTLEILRRKPKSPGEFSKFPMAANGTDLLSSTARLILITDVPPSTNRLFANSPGRGRRKTAGYRAWLVKAGWELKLQRIAPLAGPVAIDITLPDRRGRLPDADNALKASIDLLVRHGIIEEDDRSIVRQLSVAWDADAPAVAIRITSLLSPRQADAIPFSGSAEVRISGEGNPAKPHKTTSRKGEAR